MTTEEYRAHAVDCDFMGEVERDQARIKATAEVFTPATLVNEMLDALQAADPEIFVDPDRTFFEPTLGDGQFLVEIVARKMEQGGVDLIHALKSIYGVEMMEDNLARAKKRLAGPNPTEEILTVLNENLKLGDALDESTWKEVA